MNITFKLITQFAMRRLQEEPQLVPMRLLLHKHQRNGTNTSINTKQSASENKMTSTNNKEVLQHREPALHLRCVSSTDTDMDTPGTTLPRLSPSKRGNKASVCGDKNWTTARDNPPTTHRVTQGNDVRVCGSWLKAPSSPSSLFCFRHQYRLILLYLLQQHRQRHARCHRLGVHKGNKCRRIRPTKITLDYA